MGVRDEVGGLGVGVGDEVVGSGGSSVGDGAEGEAVEDGGDGDSRVDVGSGSGDEGGSVRTASDYGPRARRKHRRMRRQAEDRRARRYRAWGEWEGRGEGGALDRRRRTYLERMLVVPATM